LKTKDLVLKSIIALQHESQQPIFYDDIVKELRKQEVLATLKELESEGKVQQMKDGRWVAT